jgi:nucleoside 2-deoxyribosyltransferase
LSNENTIEGIKKYFFEIEKASVLVLKMGAKGALVFDKSGHETKIPVYKTDYVWTIGSGDIFAAVFAHYWFENEDAVNAAQEASWQTACYCNLRRIEISKQGSIKGIEPLTIDNYPKGLVYLAGPFFTFAERWLIDQIRTALLGSHLQVFSPWHDVGHGVASEVVSKDLNALDKAQMVFAVVDGLDSGTLFEIGYAIKSNIPVIAYVENETLESVKMLEGTNCILEKDLTTAIYKCFWKLSQQENA